MPRKAKVIEVPKGTLTSREVVETRLRPLVNEKGAAVVASQAGMSVSMLHRVLRCERAVNEKLARLVGVELRELRFYVPVQGGKNDA